MMPSQQPQSARTAIQSTDGGADDLPPPLPANPIKVLWAMPPRLRGADLQDFLKWVMTWRKVHPKLLALGLLLIVVCGQARSQTYTCPSDNPKTQQQLLAQFQSCATQGLPAGCITPEEVQDLICSVPSHEGTSALSGIVIGADQNPGALGTPVMVVGTAGTASVAQNALVGETTNNLTAAATAFPTGVSGYGQEKSVGNQVFGLFGLGELRATAGVAVGAEMTARNFGGTPDTSLPPNTAIGTTTRVVTGQNITCGTETGTSDCSIGLYISNESGSNSNPVFNTGEYIALYRQYGLFIDAQPSGPHTGEVIKNNGSGVNLQLLTPGTTPANAVLEIQTNALAPLFTVSQSGNVNAYGTLSVSPIAYASLPACASGTEGSMIPVTNSSTATWGAQIDGNGTGTNHVLAYCDGTHWTVAAK